MTRREAEAFNAGVPAVLALATLDLLALQVEIYPKRYELSVTTRQFLDRSTLIKTLEA